MKKLIVIIGQTATGKTSLALKLARLLKTEPARQSPNGSSRMADGRSDGGQAKERGGELVNADSRQIYKYLDIITGKDVPKNAKFCKPPGLKSGTKKPRGLKDKLHAHVDIGYYMFDDIKLWLYDAADPKTPFSSFDYKTLADKVIDDIVSRGKIPIIIGGTYLYIKHLLYGFETENIPPDWKLREQLNVLSVSELQKKLKKLNFQLFKRLNTSDRQNPRRLIRQIEIAQARRIGGQAQRTPGVGEQHEKTPGVDKGSQLSKYQILNTKYSIADFIGLRFKKREDLVAKIEKRVEKRLTQGAIDEVKNLLERGYTKRDPGLKTMGFKQLIEYVEGKKAKEQAIQEWITDEIQYAKRQYTFMKKDKNIKWVNV